MSEAKTVQLLKDAIDGDNTVGGLVTICAAVKDSEIAGIKNSYYTTFNADLMQDIKRKTSSDFEMGCLALFTALPEYEASCFRKAVQGINDFPVVVELLCSRTDAELKELGATYTRMYREEFRQRVHSEFSAKVRLSFETILGGRSSSCDIKTAVAQLYRAGEGKLGTDEKTFIRILCGHTREVVDQIREAYVKTHGKCLLKVINSEFSGKLEKIMLALTMPLDLYFAERFIDYFTGSNVNERDVMRLIRTRKEKNILAISRQLHQHKKKGWPLSQWCVEKLGAKFKRLCVATVANWAI